MKNNSIGISKAVSYLKKLVFDGFFHILTGNFLNKAISMISSIVIVNLVDKTVYADISYADNLYSYISLASGLGMSNALLKFCSVNQSKELDKAYIRFAMKIGGAFEIIAALLLCIIISFVDIPYTGARMFIWGFLIYPVIDYSIVTGSIYMRTQLDNKKYAYVGIARSIILCVLSILFVLIFGTSGIVSARYLSALLVLAYVVRYYKNMTRQKKPAILTTEQKMNFFKVGISLGIAGFFSGIMPINESFLVNNVIKDPIITANFRVAGLLPQMLFLVSGAITVYYFPIIARMTNPAEIKRKVINIALVNGVIILILTILGMRFTPLAIRLLYGQKYMDSVSISYLLWIMRAANCVIRMVPINMLPAIGKTKFNLYMSIVSCAMQCVLDYIFIKYMGIGGVAIGATIVYTLSGICYWIYFFKCCRSK